MPDIICPLHDVPEARPLLERLHAEGITVRRARAWERTAVSEFILAQFGQGWLDEALMAFAHHPVTIFVARDAEQIVGFAAYEVTGRAYFGPTGVLEAMRGRGIGKALLLASLEGLRELGYTYGFIGSPGPIEFYLKATPGLLLPADWSSVYTGAVGS